MYTEAMEQIHAASMTATSVFVSPKEPCLVKSVDHVFLVTLIPLAPTILPPPLLLSSPSSA